MSIASFRTIVEVPGLIPTLPQRMKTVREIFLAVSVSRCFGHFLAYMTADFRENFRTFDRGFPSLFKFLTEIDRKFPTFFSRN